MEKYVKLYDNCCENYEAILTTILDENREIRVPLWIVDFFKVRLLFYF